MSFAISTAILFAFSAICNTKVSRLMDQITANLIRLIFATFILGLATIIIEPKSFHPEASTWLLFSGIVGFGIGDIALFMALSKIGSRLTILINFCTATLVGALSDWIWLGDTIKKENIIFIISILAGLSLALLPKNPRTTKNNFYKVGIIAAGTSDIYVGEEARLVCESMNCDCICSYDVGIAGLHRIFPVLKQFIESEVNVIIVVAGMEGALASIVSSIADVPVIGVPTSIGYGYGEKGIAALASMLQSCSLGLTVVNIDNGVGAGAAAANIANRIKAKSTR